LFTSFAGNARAYGDKVSADRLSIALFTYGNAVVFGKVLYDADELTG
jgi:hypothetical protein